MAFFLTLADMLSRLGYSNVKLTRLLTERDELNAALRESQERFLIAKDAAGLGIHDLDVASGAIQWDDRVRELWAVGPDEEITYDVFLSGVHPDDREATQAAVDKAMDPGGDGLYDATYRVVGRDDGRVHWVHAAGRVSFEDGHPLRLVGAVEDVTRRKHEEARAQQELETTRLLLQAAESLVSRRSLSSVLDTLADLALRLTAHSRATVILWHEESRSLTVETSKGATPLAQGLRVAFDDLSIPAQEAIELKASRVIDYDALPQGRRGVSETIPSFLALDVPLVYRGRLFGLLAIDDPDERRAFEDQEIRLVEGIASQAAVAIENARLLAVEQERARFAETLSEIDTGLRTSLDRREMIRGAVAEGARVLGADSGALSRHRGHDFVVEYAVGFSEDPTGLVMADELEHHSLLALETRRPVLVENVHTDPRVEATHLLSYGVGAVIVVPLIVADEAYADLFFNFTSPRRFSPTEVEFARRLGASLSLALENARLYAQQQRIATTLQENLIHPLPEVDGLELAIRSLPANEPELVGGDFSDVFLLADGRVVIVIGDVAGKGIRAAGLTETVRSTMRAFATIDSAPPFILRKTNELLLRHGQDETHVTAFVCVLDPRTGYLAAASAGHPAPVHLSPFSCRILDLPFGPPLGTFAVDYVPTHLTLTPDDCLVLFTDGVMEARRGGEMLGEARLVQIVEQRRGLSAPELAQAVADEALAFGGGLRDDLHVVVVRLA